MHKCRIALIEDDATMGQSLKERFELEGWPTCWFASCAQAEANWPAILEADVVISDLRLQDGNGAEIFSRYRERGGEHPFILITAYASVSQAVQLIRDGLHDYWPKPFDIEQVIGELSAILDQSERQSEWELGLCPAMQQVQRLIERVATSKVNILVTGETGTGKEEVVRFLHRAAGGKGPLEAVNSGAIPAELLESELFGHEKGAFTGAAARRIGRIEQANGGILFLDEIGEMPLPMQVKLLRVLQDRKLRRLGGTDDIPVDFRLVCATHRDLKQMVENGEFREDLFYRINVVHVHLPPLRERGTDVLWLTQRMLEEIAGNEGRIRGLLPDAEQALLAYSFPGNVRELRNILERAVALGEGPFLSRSDLFPAAQSGSKNEERGSSGGTITLKDQVRQAEIQAITQALEESGQQISEAAKLLGISRKNLWEKMKKLGIEAASSAD